MKALHQIKITNNNNIYIYDNIYIYIYIYISTVVSVGSKVLATGTYTYCIGICFVYVKTLKDNSVSRLDESSGVE